MRMPRSLPSIILAGSILWSPSGLFGKIKVTISADMEGIVGVVTREQLGPAGFEYQRFREFMTAEVNAAIEGARAAGATEILISDSHGNGQNLLIEKLPVDVRIIRSWPRPLMMMQGIDDSFDAAIFIGYHSSTTNPSGVRAHTLSSARLAEVRLNGIPMSEAGISAAIAGHFGVPVVLITGDDAVVQEAQTLLGEIEGAVVKWAYSFHAAQTMTPTAAYDLIRRKSQQAVKERRKYRPYRLKSPIQLDVTFKNYRPSELLSYLPSVERTDSHSIRFVAQDMVAISRFLEFMLSYDSTLEP